MTDTTPGGWPDASKPGVPMHPERDGVHMMEWTDEHGRVWREVWKWRADSKPAVWLRPNFTGGPYGYEPKHLTAPIYASLRYLGPCHTPAEVAALTEWRDEPPGGISKGGVLYLSPERVAAQVEAARREEREANIAACQKAVPRAHTYASENADIYRAGDAARDQCIEAIRARGEKETGNAS